MIKINKLQLRKVSSYRLAVNVSRN